MTAAPWLGVNGSKGAVAAAAAAVMILARELIPNKDTTTTILRDSYEAGVDELRERGHSFSTPTPFFSSLKV